MSFPCLKLFRGYNIEALYNNIMTHKQAAIMQLFTDIFKGVAKFRDIFCMQCAKIYKSTYCGQYK